ncbi:MAG: universal stress protein [Pseudorhodoplanes sp.]|nr:universal stress protein [Pseudorhodoplanes sp.]
MFRKILNANDGSENAFKALSAAIAFAKADRAELHMIVVEELTVVPEWIEEVREEKIAADRRFKNLVKRAKTEAREADVELKAHVFAGHPVRTIIDFVRDNGFDLLVIGATGHSNLYETMVGSRAERLVHLSPCPVMVVK